MKVFLILTLALLSTNDAFSQTTSRDSLPSADTLASSFIHIRYADELQYQIVGLDTVQKLIGHVELNQDTVFIFCDSSTIVNSTDMVAQGNFILQQGDSTTIFADSSEYSSDTKIADLYSNVAMLKGRQKLFTEHLTYDVNTKIAVYLTGATLTDDTTFLKSTRGYFHAKTDDIFFRDSVVVVSPDFTLRSDTLKFNARTKIVTFLAPTLIDQDTARIYTESGFYNINRKFAEFNKNPQYVKNDQKAWADKMTYDGNIKEVVLIGDAHFEDSTSVANADVIRRNETTGVTVLEGNAFFQDEERTLSGDTIYYDSKNETYSTRGRSHIVDGAQILDADQVDYLKDREVGIATGKVVFQDTTEKMTVICEYAEHSQKRNFLKAIGGRDSLGRPARPLMIKVIDGDSMFISADTLLSYEPGSEFDSLQVSKEERQPGLDSLQSSVSSLQSVVDTLLQESGDSIAGARSLVSQDSVEIVEPLEKPLDEIPEEVFEQFVNGKNGVSKLISIPETDTLTNIVDSISAPSAELGEDLIQDTIQAADQKQGSDDERIILAFNDVRIYKNNLQALCDSLSYSSVDSMFRLFKEPIIWSDTSQFTAKHMRIQLANGAIDRIYLVEESFIINTPDEVFYNQIQGRNSIAHFDSSELRRVMVSGNAEAVYYALDDEQAYIGVNKTACSEMKILFGNNEVEGIVFYAQPNSNLIPMKEADHDALRLEGFSWQIDRRPITVEDLIKINKRRASVPIPAALQGSNEKVDSKREKPKKEVGREGQ